jgi:glycosyltransferase involved in cell wall biosynthesis
MAAGRPVIATNAGGPPHLLSVPAGGRLVPVQDVQALGEAIIDICKLPATERSAMGEHNRLRALEHFSWDHATDLLEQALTELVASS